MFHYRRKLDLEAVRKAAGHFVGTHDFSSFCADCANVSTTVRTIYSFDIENSGDSVIMLVKGNGFLYNMIRIMVGTLIDVSEKRIAPDDIPQILEIRIFLHFRLLRNLATLPSRPSKSAAKNIQITALIQSSWIA